MKKFLSITLLLFIINTSLANEIKFFSQENQTEEYTSSEGDSPADAPIDTTPINQYQMVLILVAVLASFYIFKRKKNISTEN